MEGITHDTLAPLIDQLGRGKRDAYFVWRRRRWSVFRSEHGRFARYDDSRFLSDCLQWLLAEETQAARATNALAYVPPTDSN